MFLVRHSSSLKYFGSACRAVSPSSLVGFASSITPNPTLGALSGDPCAEGNAASSEPLGLPLGPIIASAGQALVLLPQKKKNLMGYPKIKFFVHICNRFAVRLGLSFLKYLVYSKAQW